MRIPEHIQFDHPHTENIREWGSRHMSQLLSLYRALIEVLHGGITFGDGTDTDNVRGEWITITTNATGGLETTIPHNLGEIPTGAVMMKPPASGTWNMGATPWTSTNVYMTFSANSQTVTLFLTAPPRTS